MPRHLISDVHEWSNEILTVPIYTQVNPQSRGTVLVLKAAGKEDPLKYYSSLDEL